MPPAGIDLAIAIVVGACALAAWRLARSRRRRRGPPRQESALPYEIWYGLRQKDVAAADRFLAGMWDRRLAERTAAAAGRGGGRRSGSQVQALLESQVAEMTGAAESLRRFHAGEAGLPAALEALEERVRRLCDEFAATQEGEAS